MKSLVPFLLSALLLSLAGADAPISLISEARAAALPAVWQRKLDRLVKDISNSRRNLSTTTSADLKDDFKHNQWLKRLENYRQSINKVPSTDDPRLVQANQALAALEREYAARRGEGTAPAPGKAPPASAGRTQAQGQSQAGIREKTGASATSASASTSAGQANANRPSNVRPLVSNDRVRIKKLIRDITSRTDSISGTGPSPLQDPDVVAQRKKSLDQFAAAVKRYPQTSDPDVIKLREAYAAYAQKLKAEYGRASGQMKIVGNAFARLETIDNRDKEYPVPPPLSPPFSAEDARAWLSAGSKARQAAEFDSKQLKEIGEHAYLPEQTVSGRMARYSFRDVERLNRRVQGRFNGVQGSYKQSMANVEQRLAELENQVQPPRTTDDAPTTARHRQSLEAMQAVLQSAIDLESVLKRPTAAFESRLTEMKRWRAAYDRTRDEQIAAVRMPAPKSTNAEMLAVAKKVLANPDYEFGPHGPVVLNATEIVSREKKTSELDIDKIGTYGGKVTLSGTETTWTYRWREFQFATALREPQSELWRIHYIMAKYFTSGASKTPLNRWVSGGVVATDLITREAAFR